MAINPAWTWSGDTLTDKMTELEREFYANHRGNVPSGSNHSFPPNGLLTQELYDLLEPVLGGSDNIRVSLDIYQPHLPSQLSPTPRLHKIAKSTIVPRPHTPPYYLPTGSS